MLKDSQGSVVVTLFEGDYHLGVGALANSLYENGFRGKIYVGYRGELGGWTKNAIPNGAFLELSPAEGLSIRLVEIDLQWHLANLKPSFMLRALREFEPAALSVFYFDPDITVKCRWSFFEEWVAAGAAMVCEVYMNPMPESHPFRAHWMKEMGKPQKRAVDFYINSGFLGCRRENACFIEKWQAITLIAEARGHDMQKYKSGDQSEPFNSFDQDWLNCAIMTSEHPISIMGSEAMDLKPGGFVMSHAVESIKPWRPGMGRQVLKGLVPTQPLRNFWRHTQWPLRIYSPGYAKFKRFKIGVAVFIGRFYRKV